MTDRSLTTRRRYARIISAAFTGYCLAATLLCVLTLFVLVWNIVSQGVVYLNWDFLNNFPSRHLEQAGIKSALAGSLWLTALTEVS